MSLIYAFIKYVLNIYSLTGTVQNNEKYEDRKRTDNSSLSHEKLMRKTQQIKRE